MPVVSSLVILFGRVINTHNSAWCQSFSPDSQWLVSCKDNGMLDFFSVNPFAYIKSLATHPGLASHANDPIGGVDWYKIGYISPGSVSAFKKDMKRKDYTIKIWRMEEK